jgi:predicted transposase YbfD/YdcC
MTKGFLDHMRIVPDHRIPGMVTYPLDEILLTTLVGVVCGGDDWEGIEEVAAGALDWLRRFLPFANGVARAQTLRKVFRLLDAQALEQGFSAWASSLRPLAREVVAVDGKTLCGSRQSDGTGALHLVSAYATAAGLVLAQRAVDSKSNEITAIPELLDMLALEGAIVSIDAMGTQKAIAARIVDKKADYVLALKGNQTSLHEDAKLFFADPALIRDACAFASETDAGHGRVEERTCRVADAAWLSERHSEWKNLRSLAAITARRIDKKTRAESVETRFYISSLAPDPEAVLAATRAHWGIENNLHWTLDVIFDEDRCRTRKDHSPLNLAVIRHAALNILKVDKSKGSLRRKRLRACIDPTFRSTLFAA